MNDVRRDDVDEVAEWFDYWIDTYRHPGTAIFADRWSRPRGEPRAVVGIVEQGAKSHIYDIERSSAT